MNIDITAAQTRIQSALAADFIDKNIKSTHARSALKKGLKSHDMAWLVDNIEVEELDGGLHQVLVRLKPRAKIGEDEAFELKDLEAVSIGMAAIAANPKLTEVAYVPSKNVICFQYQPEKSARTKPEEDQKPGDVAEK